jgi:hypothetical protein
MSERNVVTAGHPGRRMRQTPADPARMAAALDGLVRGKGLGRWAYFWTTVEGFELPGDLEEYSGYLVDDRGRAFTFWMGAHPDTGAPALTVWERVEPEPSWDRSAEYRRAREKVGLGAA